MILKRVSLLICLLTIFNCSSSNNKFDKSLASNQKTADLMYIEAMDKFNSKQLDEAIVIFEEIERLYPLSNEAIQSQIMSGFIDYGNLNYDDAFEVGYSHRTNSSNSNLIIFHLSNEVSVGLCYDRPFLNRLGGINLKTYEILIRVKTN